MPFTKEQLLSAGEHTVNLEFRISNDSVKPDFTLEKIQVSYEDEHNVLCANYPSSSWSNIYFGDGIRKMDSNETLFVITDSDLDYTEELEEWIQDKKISKKNAQKLNTTRYFIRVV
jgi:TusA-related sulfurtransferase